MAVAGLGSEGQLPSVEEEQTAKKSEKTYQKVKKDGPEKSSLEDLKVAQQQMIDYGYLGAVGRVKKGSNDAADVQQAQQYNAVTAAIEAKSATKVPPEESKKDSGSSAPAASSGSSQPSPVSAPSAKVESTPTQTATPIPAESSPVGQRVQGAIRENNDMKVEESTSPKVISVDNSKVINAGGDGGGSSVVVDSSVPVRIDDPTLQKIAKQNLRPV